MGFEPAHPQLRGRADLRPRHRAVPEPAGFAGSRGALPRGAAGIYPGRNRHDAGNERENDFVPVSAGHGPADGVAADRRVVGPFAVNAIEQARKGARVALSCAFSPAKFQRVAKDILEFLSYLLRRDDPSI